MTWTQFWNEFENIIIMIQNIVSAFPSMLLDVLFACLSFGAVWVLVKMIREVRS